MSTTPGEDLLEAATRLEGCLLDVQREAVQLRTQALEVPEFRRLRQVVEHLGSGRPARAVVCAEEYLALWRQYRAGKISTLPRAAIRSLAWEPDVATSIEFIELLTRVFDEPTARILQGLVQSLHRRWPQSSDLTNRLEALVRAYRGPNRVITKWREGGGMLLHSAGTRKCGIDMVHGGKSLEEQVREWFLSPSSGYVRALVEAALFEALRWSDASTPRATERILELVFWEDWEAAGFKKAIDMVLLSQAMQQRNALREEVKSRILRDPRLGDPRFPRNENNWLGVTPEARAVFVRLLSADDIEFFFEHVLPPGSDPHGRKRFWLQYVGQLQRSRAILDDEAMLRLRRTVPSSKLKTMILGRMSGSTSGFLLDFGRIFVVEFSQVNNACYVYDRRHADLVVPDFWSSDWFHPTTGRSGLKRRDLPHDRVTRQSKNWTYELASLLARHGIRRD